MTKCIKPTHTALVSGLTADGRQGMSWDKLYIIVHKSIQNHHQLAWNEKWVTQLLTVMKPSYQGVDQQDLLFCIAIQYQSLVLYCINTVEKWEVQNQNSWSEQKMGLHGKEAVVLSMAKLNNNVHMNSLFILCCLAMLQVIISLCAWQFHFLS
jgi:hypothetical protein